MTTTTKNIVTLIAVAAIVVAFSTQSEAGCHGHGGGHGGFSVSIHRPSYNSYQPRYQPTYRQPTYSQPNYVNTPPNSIPPQQFPQQQFPQQGQPFAQGQPQQQGQPFAQGQPQQQGQPFAQGQPQQQQRIAQQQQAPQQRQAATPQTQAPASAETSALEALGGFAPPQSEETTPVATNSELPTHVGRWSATLSNGARIQLDLNDNGSFTWSAINKDGKASSFEGSYQVNSGSLTLIRSDNNQSLAGSLETSGSNAFSFKLADQKAAKLEFVRA
ncbi:hypothetical protein LOC68_02700 [Blastopirellula sp. JC732]|uniref:Uncharacterized protein n=1 Tax=Blastopirellula sediminis TaxID=2894196 RepID=A0A9X1MHN7_9BACT|nr:hypothetical protein [Blastopirellula sediminis]MCC9607914.1 hypothetical protein [Blastopirellula sediminis]MCC9627293.1 hypothetical protein [Blastopirellula sediminis]